MVRGRECSPRRSRGGLVVMADTRCHEGDPSKAVISSESGIGMPGRKASHGARTCATIQANGASHHRASRRGSIPQLHAGDLGEQFGLTVDGDVLLGAGLPGCLALLYTLIAWPMNP